MIVRIRLHSGPKVKLARRKNRHIALALAALITPAALVACLLGFWRLAADLNMAGQFAISEGLFSHWHVWFGCAAVLEFIAIVLNRYGATVSHENHPNNTPTTATVSINP
jgi:uncharacterized RDD family membrane protein YckC